MTLVHLHLPKTGGSTLVEYLREEYGEKFYRVEGKQEISFWDELRDELKVYDCISGHLSYSSKPEIICQCQFITFIREPIDRLLSLYHYMTYNSKIGYRQKFEEIGLEKFVLGEFPTQKLHDQLHSFVDNDMVRRIGGIGRREKPVDEDDFNQAAKNIRNFSPVGLVHRYEESMFRWRNMFGWQERKLGRLLHQPDRPKREELSSALIGRIQDRQQFDYRLYWTVLERDWT